MVDYHFIRLISIQFEVIRTGPLGDVVEFIGISDEFVPGKTRVVGVFFQISGVDSMKITAELKI